MGYGNVISLYCWECAAFLCFFLVLACCRRSAWCARSSHLLILSPPMGRILSFILLSFSVIVMFSFFVSFCRIMPTLSLAFKKTKKTCFSPNHVGEHQPTVTPNLGWNCMNSGASSPICPGFICAFVSLECAKISVNSATLSAILFQRQIYFIMRETLATLSMTDYTFLVYQYVMQSGYGGTTVFRETMARWCCIWTIQAI